MSTKFRETIWFKKGMAEQLADDGDHLRPVEDAYDDDGSVTREDSQMFSVHTGVTQGVPVIARDVVALPGDMQKLVREMKRGRQKVIAAIGASVAFAASLLYLI